jgi:hypothetical protein
MNTATKTLGLLALCCAASGPALAQQLQAVPPAAQSSAPAAPSAKPTQATAQSEAGDPRADASNEPATAPARSATPSAGPAPSTGRAPAGRASADRAAPGSGSSQKSAPKIDRLELGTATVTGDREQPKVMYIVPWKRSDIGDLAGKPMNSLVDEILAPVDRDVFKREVVYYHAVQADVSQNGAPPKPGQQGEK